MGRGSPSMSTMTSTSDSLPSSIPEADRESPFSVDFIYFIYFRFNSLVVIKWRIKYLLKVQKKDIAF